MARARARACVHRNKQHSRTHVSAVRSCVCMPNADMACVWHERAHARTRTDLTHVLARGGTCACACAHAHAACAATRHAHAARVPRACQAQAMHRPCTGHCPSTGRAQATVRVVRTLHCAITRSGLETMNIGAPMMGARREAKSLVALTEEMLRTPTPERTERLSSRPAAALHIFRPRVLLAPFGHNMKSQPCPPETCRRQALLVRSSTCVLARDSVGATPRL